MGISSHSREATAIWARIALERYERHEREAAERKQSSAEKKPWKAPHRRPSGIGTAVDALITVLKNSGHSYEDIAHVLELRVDLLKEGKP